MGPRKECWRALRSESALYVRLGCCGNEAVQKQIGRTTGTISESGKMPWIRPFVLNEVPQTNVNFSRYFPAQRYGQMTPKPENSSKDTPAPEYELDDNSLKAIRSILTEQEAPTPHRPDGRKQAASGLVEQETPREVALARKKAEAFVPLSSPEVPSVEDLRPARAKGLFSLRQKLKKTPKPAAVKPSARTPEPVVGNNVLSSLKGYRPAAAHIALGVFALLALTHPWLVLGLTLLFLLILVGVFLIVGYDGFWQGAIKLGRWYANRRPARAAILHARLDSFAVRWDAILDRFPEGTVDGLYLPDFGEIATADARHAQAVERRLNGLHGNGA